MMIRTIIKSMMLGLLLAPVVRAQDIPCGNMADFVRNPPAWQSYNGNECQAPARAFCNCARAQIKRQSQQGESQQDYENCLMISVVECRNSQTYQQLKENR